MNLPVAFDPSLLLPAWPDACSTGPGQRSAAEIEQVAEDFESIFLTIMLRQMRKTIPSSGLLDQEDRSGAAYREIADVALGQYLAHSGTLGLAPAIRDQLMRGAQAGPKDGPAPTNAGKGDK